MAVDPNLSEQPKENKKKKERGGLVGWLIDSYNGLFKIVIQPQLPKPRLLGIMTLCFVVGLLWAYIINPASFYGAAPNQMGPESQELWVKLVAGSATEIRVYDGTEVQQLLNLVDDPAAMIDGLIVEEQARTDTRNLLPALQQIRPLADGLAGTDAPSSGSIIGEIFMFILAIIVFVLVANIFAVVWSLVLSALVKDFISMVKPKTEQEKRFAAERDAMRRQRELEDKMKAEMAADKSSDLGASIMQKVSLYTKARNYDDSFAIEDANDMFLGECGATIAKTLGDSQELSAIEVWLFDKEDFVRTLTKIFASEHAYNDPAIRSELEPKVENPATDIILMHEGAILSLDTDALRVQAKVVALTPGNTPGLPPNSHFDEVRLQMQAWEKTGAAVTQAAPPVPAASGGLPDMASYQIGPPPPMPGSSAPSTPPPSAPPAQVNYNPAPSAPPPQPRPAPSGLPDLSSYEIGPPPPMPGGFGSPRPPQNEPPDEDDPFAGTGDFTPLGRN